MDSAPVALAQLEAELEVLAKSLIGEDDTTPGAHDAHSTPTPTSQDDLESSAAAFACALIATVPIVTIDKPAQAQDSANESETYAVEQRKTVIADFVTPGDLLRSPSLIDVGRLVPRR